MTGSAAIGNCRIMQKNNKAMAVRSTRAVPISGLLTDI
jgi:hypothetical protein